MYVRKFLIFVMVTSKERILAALNGEPSDHVPLTTWCFGFSPAKHLRWQRDGQNVNYWYSMRMEHIHTIAEPWTLADDFKRVETWLRLGIDDILDVSVPWSQDADVTWQDTRIGDGKVNKYPILVREYQTPSGRLRHSVQQTGERVGKGWVIQPNYVPLFEDYNVSRAVEHAVSSSSDVAVIKHLYCGPNAEAKRWFEERISQVKRFADEKGVAVQAWSAFGMDAAVWLAGSQAAIMMAMDAPKAFGQLMEIIAETDYARTELAVSNPGVDMVVQRGWYSSTDFWSPGLFDKFVYPHLKKLTALAHKYHKKFGYVMTTGVEILGPHLADAGVDLLYFVDPIQDRLSLETVKQLLSNRMTLAGGTNALSLASGDDERIRREVKHAIEVLGPTNRFILHPVDALFPDTGWDGVEQMIKAWKKYR
jgi:uroporphyrinogen-III decarboxylase